MAVTVTVNSKTDKNTPTSARVRVSGEMNCQLASSHPSE